MSYQVIARKFRPQTFDDIVGQSHVTTTLRNSIQAGRIGHAFLFTGIRGVGKTTAARVLAKALNCVNGPTVTPCNVCDACREITFGTSLDVKEIDGASNRGIDSIRELRDGVAFAPTRDRNKIYIIDEVHMLTTEAFNALLKTLEEPPPNVVFIFATTEMHKVPATIASRCQVFEFKRIGMQALIDHLGYIARLEQIDADPEGLRLIAREADGSLRDACSLLDQVISFAGKTVDEAAVAEILRTGSRKDLETMLSAILAEDAAGAFSSFAASIERGLPARQVLKDLSRYLSECLRVRLLGADAARETGLTDQEVAVMARIVEGRTPEHLATLLNLFVTASDRVADSRSPELLAQAAIVKASRMSAFSAVAGLVDRLEQIVSQAPAHVPLPARAPVQKVETSYAPAPKPMPRVEASVSPAATPVPEVETAAATAPVPSSAPQWTRPATTGGRGTVSDAVSRLTQAAGIASSSTPTAPVSAPVAPVATPTAHVVLPAGVGDSDVGARLMQDPIVSRTLSLFGGEVLSTESSNDK